MCFIKKVLFFFVFVLASRAIAQVRVIDNKGTIREVDSSKWQTSGNNIYNKNSQNVGIGTSTPNNKLEISQGTAGNSGLRFTHLTSATVPTTDSDKFLTVNASGDVVLMNVDENIIDFNTANPNTGGTTFTPNVQANDDAFYYSTVNKSLWKWDGSVYVSIIFSNEVSLSGANLTTTVNGVASTALNLTPAIAAGTSNTLTNPVNTITSNVNGKIAFAPAVNTVGNTSFENSLSTSVNGVTGSAVTIINSNATSLSGTSLTTTVNGITSDALDLAPVLSGGTTNSLTNSVNIITSNVNGKIATAPAVNTVANTSALNTLTTSVNGVAGSAVAIVNSNEMGLSGTNLTSTINGVASSALDLTPAVAAATSHTISNPDNTITSTVNGVAVTAPVVNTVGNTLAVTQLTTTVNGVSSTALDLAPAVDSRIIAKTGVAGGIAPLDGNGIIPITHIPPSVTTSTFVVTNIAERDALTPVPAKGDIVITTDDNKTYIVQSTNPIVWVLLPTPSNPVSSVFGRTGNIAAQAGDYTTDLVSESANKNYQTDNQKLYNDATSSIQTQLNARATIDSPAFTGIPTAPTAVAGTSTTQIATTAFVNTALTTGTTNTLTTATNTITSTVNGKTASAPIVNTNTLTATNGSLVSIVNGVATTPAVAVLTTADNGLTTTNGNVQLGGALTKPTIITSTGTNTLAIAGLQAGGVTDDVLVADATGVLKKVTAASVAVEPWRVAATVNKATLNSENIYQNANVGIGDFTVTSPANKLEINHGTAGNSGLRFTNLTDATTPTMVTGKFLTVDAYGDVVLKNVGENIIDFTSSDNNPNTAGTTFVPNDSADIDAIYYSTVNNSAWKWNGTTFVPFTSTSTAWLQGGNSVTSQRNLGTLSNFDLPFITNSVEKMRLTTDGNLGIGITTPTAPLQFANGDGRKIALRDTANNDNQYFGFGTAPSMFINQIDQTASNFRWRAGTGASTSNDLVTLLGTGNLGINTTTPDNKLDIEQGTAGNSGLRLSSLTSATIPTLGSDKFLTVDSNGDVVLRNVGENIVDFTSSDNNPNTVGTTFVPNDVQNGDVIYYSTSDNSSWKWTGTTYVAYTPTSTAWLQGGNSVTTLRNLGTVTNFNLPIVTNNITRMTVLASATLQTTQIGVGTSTPTFTVPENIGATIPTLGVDGTVNATNYTTPVQPTFTGAAVTWNMSKGSAAKWTLAAGANTLTVSNMKPGMYGSIVCTNTGTSTLTFSGGVNKVINGGAGVPILTPIAGAVDILTYFYDGTTFWWTVGNNYN